MKNNEVEKINPEALSFDIESIFGGFTPEQDIKDPVNTEEIEEEDVEIPEDKTIVDPLEEETIEEEIEEEIEEVSEEETEDLDEDIEFSYKGMLSYLSEQGLVDFEDSEELEDSPELLENAIESTVQGLLENYKESIPEVGKQFLDYIENGGDPHKFLSSLDQGIDLDNLDLEDITNQKRVIRELLKEQNYSDEEIDEQIKDYEDGLILDKRAKTAANRLKKLHGSKAEKLLAEQAEADRLRQENHEKYIGSIRETITSSESIAGLKISKADKKAFEKYLLEVDKDGKSQYVKDVEKDPMKTQVELAYLKFKNYDFDSAKKQGGSEATRRINRMIKSTDKIRASREQRVDHNEKVDLSAFRRLM